MRSQKISLTRITEIILALFWLFFKVLRLLIELFWKDSRLFFFEGQYVHPHSIFWNLKNEKKYVTVFQSLFSLGWILEQKQVKLLILGSFWFFDNPPTPGEASIVKISWFLCLYLMIFLSGGTPDNFFSNNSK